MWSALGRWPYQKIREKLQKDLRRISPEWEIWVRNSFLTDAFKPFKSDLDFTVWMKTRPSPSQLRELRETLKRNKKVFPLLGECNAYLEEPALRFSSFFNRYERFRDPELHQRLPRAKEKEPVSLPPQRSAFLLRLLWLDRKNLRKCPKRRKKKWDHHLRSLEDPSFVGTFDPQRAFDSLLAVSLGELRKTQDPAWIYQRVKEIKPFLLSEHGSKEHRIPVVLSALYPHLFLHQEASQTPVFQALQEITQAQLAWEVWGLQSQFLLREDLHSLRDFLTRLISFCRESAKETGALGFQKLAEGFEDLHDQTGFIP